MRYSVHHNVLIFSWEPALWLVHSQARVVVMSKNIHCHFHPQTATFEHRHENKSCSACQRQECQVLQVCQVPSFCLTFRHFLAGNQLYDSSTNRRGWRPKKLCPKKWCPKFSAINSDFWAYRWKQNLFSMSGVSAWEIERVWEWDSEREWESVRKCESGKVR